MRAKCLKTFTKNKLVISNIQQFPSVLNNVPLLEDEEHASYDVKYLFTNIPIKETIDFIYHEIYSSKKLKPIYKQSIFKKLLHKLTTECTFNVKGRLRKQIDCVAMGGTLSVTVSNCFRYKMEKDVVMPLKPKFYCRNVEHTYNRRNKKSN